MKNIVSEKLRAPEFIDFFKSFLVLRNEEEIANFLKDLMTMKELENFARRLKAAQMLEAGNGYNEIERLTGLSSATIAKVSESMKYGYDGYKLVLDRSKKKK
jgi:TrpR-related protein YerC/YecD